MEKYLVDPVKFVLYWAAALLLLITGVAGIFYGAWVFSLVFLASSVPFFIYAAGYGATLELSASGVTKRLFPGTAGHRLPFSEIKEVGVVGTNPFNPTPDKGEKTGVIYIYFSANVLERDERYMLAYRWPRDIFYLRYTDRRYASVRRFWDGEIVQYNTGSRIF